MSGFRADADARPWVRTSAAERAQAVRAVRRRIADEKLSRVSGLRSLLRAVSLAAPPAAAAYLAARFDSPWLWALYFGVATAAFCTLPALYHEATHGSVSRNHLVNDAVGTLAAALHGVPFGTWRYFHLTHHANTGTDDDSEYYPTCWSRCTLLTFPFTQWVFLTILWRWTWGTMRGSGPRWIRSGRQRRAVTANAACTVAVWVAEAGACVAWPWLLLILIAPCATSLMVASLTLVPEHFPAYRIGPGESDQLDRTGTFRSNRALRLILWNSNFHAAHHFAPKVPAHRLRAVDALVGTIQDPAWRWPGYARWYRERLHELSWTAVDLSAENTDAGTRTREPGPRGETTINAADDRLPSAPDVIVVYSDLHCSFAHLAVHRLHETRAALGLYGKIWFDHRVFPLELFNERVNSLRGVNSEISVVGALAPEAGWRLWQAPEWEYPASVLLPMEAVQAAKSQSWAAAEELDRGLRRAFWLHSRCIALRHVILDVGASCPSLDLDRLTRDLDQGTARRTLFEQFAQARGGRVDCSPHIFLHDGTDSANPGVARRWVNGAFGVGFPVIDDYDPKVYEQLLTHAAGLAEAAGR